MKRSTVSVVIPTLNVVSIIRPTLESVRWCDEVVIVDMSSTDGSLELFKEYPNVVVYTNHDYIYRNVNLGIEKATSDWIIRLDSDEVVEDDLKTEIEKILAMDQAPFDGYLARSHLYFLGYHLKHGFAYNNYRTTFFRKGFATYKGDSEHEEMIRKGKWGNLQGYYSHYTNPTISFWLRKLNYYSDKDVERMPLENYPGLLKGFYITFRWALRFFFRQRAYKDGVPGMVVMIISILGLVMMYLKAWEKVDFVKKGRKAFPDHPNCKHEIK